MTTMAKLLANKQELLKLAKINTAFDLLDGPEGKDPP